VSPQNDFLIWRPSYDSCEDFLKPLSAQNVAVSEKTKLRGGV